MYFESNETLSKFQTFHQNHGLNPLEKMPIFLVFKTFFLFFRKACLLHKTSKIFALRFIFTIYDMGIQRVRRGCRGLQGVKGGYKGLQGVTGGYKGLQW